MKELSIEQKARRYDEAIEKFNVILNLNTVKESGTIFVDDVRKIFPELKESEDERIRKFIANELICLRAAFDKGDCRYEELSNAINWLEKHEDCQKKINHAYAKGLADAQKALKKQGECHISHDDEIMIKQLTEYFTTGHGLQNTNGTVVEWLNDVKEKLEKQGKKEVKSTEEFETFVRWFVKQRTDNYTLIPSEEDIRKWADLILSHAKQELEKQGEQILANSAKTCKDEQKPNPCDECVNRKGCINCENGELREIEQKPIDKVEPKFKVEKDKWYVCISQYCNCIEGRNYKAISDGRIIDDYGTEYDMHSDAYKWFRPWTIQDAKNGDVLSYRDGQWIFIYKEKIDDSSFYYHTLYSTIHQDLTINDSAFTLLGDAIIPATKEQHDLLFQKMKEAGYEWDSEKKELKKIEQSTIEEVNGEDYGIDSLYHAQRILEKTLGSVDGYQSDDGILEHKCAITAIKELYAQQQEWSEEDEKIIQDIINDIAIAQEQVYCKTRCEDEINWLKFLKERYTWKPSDEQMDALYTYIYNPQYFNSPDPRMELVESVYKDLKKIKE